MQSAVHNFPIRPENTGHAVLSIIPLFSCAIFVLYCLLSTIICNSNLTLLYQSLTLIFSVAQSKLSGPPTAITQITDMFDYCTEPDAVTPISLDVWADRDEPGSIALALGTNRYLYRMMSYLYPDVHVSVRFDKLILSGEKRKVHSLAQLIEYFLESPRKRLGTLFHVPDDEVEGMSAMRTEIARITRFAKGRIPEVTDVKTNKSYVFCSGLPHVESHYWVNSYLNDIFYNNKKNTNK